MRVLCRDLREVQKKLMLHDNLVPPSPLLGTTTVMPSRLALEPRDVLEGKKAELETRVRRGGAWGQLQGAALDDWSAWLRTGRTY